MASIPKLTYDATSKRSNIYEVESKLNLHVQQNFQTLEDCIKRRAIKPFTPPTPPVSTIPTTSTSSGGSSHMPSSVNMVPSASSSSKHSKVKAKASQSAKVTEPVSKRTL